MNGTAAPEVDVAQSFQFPGMKTTGRRWHVSKFVLRCVSIFCCVALLALTVISIASGKSTSWVLSLMAAAVTLIYDLTEVLFIVCVRRNLEKGLHPGCAVAGESVVGTILVICASFVPVMGKLAADQPGLANIVRIAIATEVTLVLIM